MVAQRPTKAQACGMQRIPKTNVMKRGPQTNAMKRGPKANVILTEARPRFFQR
jgi:hypothetical protein